MIVIELMLLLIGLLILVMLMVVYLRKSNLKYKRRISLNPYELEIMDIDKMKDGSEFELYLYILFIELGYSDTYKTTGSRDFGADLVFTDSNDERNVIQAKRYGVKNKVGIKAVQEIYTSLRFYKAKKAIVITTSKYTDTCDKLAGVNGVKLLDRTDLVNIIRYLKKGDKLKARQIIESEPRMVYDSWTTYMDSKPTIKKDFSIEMEYDQAVK